MTFDKMRLAALALVWWAHDQAGDTVVPGEQSPWLTLLLELEGKRLEGTFTLLFILTLKRYA